MNDRSSRSHQILTVIVEGLHQVTKARSHACLHLIDLAGSERVSKSEASGELPGSSNLSGCHDTACKAAAADVG
jgi:kinesin family protein C2/C3